MTIKFDNHNHKDLTTVDGTVSFVINANIKEIHAKLNDETIDVIQFKNDMNDLVCKARATKGRQKILNDMMRSPDKLETYKVLLFAMLSGENNKVISNYNYR